MQDHTQAPDKGPNEGADAMAFRHSREIQRIIDEHAALAIGKDGAELSEVREKCSRAIAEVCRRHVTEAHAQDLRDANERLLAQPSGEGAEAAAVDAAQQSAR